MPKIGSLEVVCGSMFSGKSEELMRRMKRALLAGKNPVIFKPAIDDRYNRECVCSHDGRVMEAVSISHAMELFGYI
ncbi:MAG: thymidine kinase, partial [Niameybacter sp.]